MMKLISHKIFLKHDLLDHPERAERIRKALKLFPYEQATNGSIYLSKVHTHRYIDKVEEASKEAGDGLKFLDAGETYVGKDTYRVACYAVGAAVQAAEYAKKGKNAFALVRPPGHHAHPDWTNGFCIFNNIGIAAVHLAEKNARVLIIDIDLHRGDGTSEIVQEFNHELGDRMYYFSINQIGVFPGMSLDEGNIRNVYVEPETTEDQYIEILHKEIPALMHKFKPSVIAISAGSDSFHRDKEMHRERLGCGLSLTKKTIYALKKIIHSKPYFAVLEGGYDPDSVVEGVGAFLGVIVKGDEEKKKPVAKKVKKAKKLQKGTIKKRASPRKRLKKGKAAKKKSVKVKRKKAVKKKKAKKKRAKPAKKKKAAKKKAKPKKKAVKKKAAKKK
ncbi:hypothetical protein KY349_03730 [Candidatus Woesearchaeota archaeon]|nr:hypothetical protein [Candidatus Woesearchaeota archaeon]